MALLFMAGGDFLRTTAHQADLFTASTGDNSSADSGIPPAGRCFTGNSDTDSWSQNITLSTTVIVGFHIHYSTIQGAGEFGPEFFNIRSGTDNQVGLRWNARQRRWEIWLNDVFHQASTKAVAEESPLKGYIWVELKVIGGPFGSYEFRIMGNTTPVLSATGVNTGSSFNNIECVYITYLDMRIDNIYVFNDQGSVNNDFFGRGMITTLWPGGAGGSTQWTPSAGANFDALDEEVPDEVAYVESSTTGQLDLYNLDTLSAADNIAGIKVNTYANDLASASDGLINKVKRTSTISGASQVAGQGSYLYLQDVFETDSEGAAWTLTNLNNTEVGFESVI